MSTHLASLAALCALWLVIALLCSLGLRAAWPAFERGSARLRPEDRAFAAWLAAVAPVLLPSAVVLLCALPGIGGLLTGAGDHCIAHGDHPHFCPVHATLPMTPLLAAALLLFTLVASGLALRSARLLRSVGREGRWLDRRHAGALAPGVQLVGGSPAIALTHGLLSPEIWIGVALHRALRADERAVVVAHERAHVERRDPLRFLLAAIGSALHLPGARDAILRALRLATEQACDARAAAAIGDRLQVASTLLRVERLVRTPDESHALTASLVDASLPARIELLLADARPRTERAVARPLLWLAAAGSLLLARPVHHVAEHALEALLRSMVGLPLLS